MVPKQIRFLRRHTQLISSFTGLPTEIFCLNIKDVYFSKNEFEPSQIENYLLIYSKIKLNQNTLYLNLKAKVYFSSVGNYHIVKKVKCIILSCIVSIDID